MLTILLTISIAFIGEELTGQIIITPQPYIYKCKINKSVDISWYYPYYFLIVKIIVLQEYTHIASFWKAGRRHIFQGKKRKTFNIVQEVSYGFF